MTPNEFAAWIKGYLEGIGTGRFRPEHGERIVEMAEAIVAPPQWTFQPWTLDAVPLSIPAEVGDGTAVPYIPPITVTAQA